MTFKMAKNSLAFVGCTLRYAAGEYRVRHTVTGCVYFTGDRDDAVETGHAMAEEHARAQRDYRLLIRERALSALSL